MATTNRPVDLCQDRAWLDAFRRGDKAAMERVFRTYAPYVMAIIRRGYSGGASGGTALGTHNPDEQQELMQDVFVRVLQPGMRERYDGVRPYAAFLRSVVGNVMLEHVRRKMKAASRTVDVPDGMEPEGMAGWTPDVPLPDEMFMDEQERQLAGAFVATLTPDEQAFVEKRFVDGMSQRDAADVLGLGRQTVRTLEKVMRDKLGAFLKARGVKVEEMHRGSLSGG